MGLLHHISFKRDNGRTEELDLLVSTSDCYLDLCLIQSQPKYQQILRRQCCLRRTSRAASNFPSIPVAISEEYIFQFQIQYLVKQSISKIAPFLILKYFFHLQQDCGPGPGEDLRNQETADTTFRFSCWWLKLGRVSFGDY